MATATRVSRADGFGRSTRFYEVGGRKLPSVTSILGAINKPALIPWAAKQEREMVVKAAADLYEDMLEVLRETSRKPPEKDARLKYQLVLEARVGKEKAHVKALGKAADIGSEAHALIEWTLRNELQQAQGAKPEVSEKALWAFMAWEDWRKSVNMVPLLIESSVWSLTHGYAGTLDLACELDCPWGGRGVTVSDFKTGKAIYPEASLQIASYAEAALEMGILERPLGGCVVRLPKAESDPDFEVKFVDPSEITPLGKTFLHVLELWKWLDEQSK